MTETFRWRQQSLPAILIAPSKFTGMGIKSPDATLQAEAKDVATKRRLKSPKKPCARRLRRKYMILVVEVWP